MVQLILFLDEQKSTMLIFLHKLVYCFTLANHPTILNFLLVEWSVTFGFIVKAKPQPTRMLFMLRNYDQIANLYSYLLAVEQSRAYVLKFRELCISIAFTLSP